MYDQKHSLKFCKHWQRTYRFTTIIQGTPASYFIAIVDRDGNLWHYAVRTAYCSDCIEGTVATSRYPENWIPWFNYISFCLMSDNHMKIILPPQKRTSATNRGIRLSYIRSRFKTLMATSRQCVGTHGRRNV